MLETTYQLYIQLFSVGLLWVSLHCGGMCGPIMAGLSTSSCSPTRPESSPLNRLTSRALGVLSYQAGRGLIYALMGAGVGALGSLAEAHISHFTRISGLIAGALILAIGLSKLLPKRYLPTSSLQLSQRFGAQLGALIRRAARIIPTPGPARMALLGALLATMPCMLTGWVLGLSAASSSPLHGALLMLGLIAMTTPILLLSASLSSLPARLKNLPPRLLPLGLILSGTWTLLISAAANGWLRHIHIPLSIGQERYVIMLW
jgi:sulfite exporter TauE/SafE